MKPETTNSIRKTSSGLGFMLFISSITMSVTAVIMTLPILNRLDTVNMLLMNTFVSIVSMFIIGLFYCWFSKTSPADIINVKWVGLGTAVPLILMALTVSFTADYLTELLQSSFSIFGVENAIDMDFESKTALENVINVIAICITPALVEEFMFRGIVLGKLRYFGDGFALMMSALTFGVMHGNIIQIPFAFLVGLALGFITIKTNSILPAMVTHFLVNFRSIITTIIMGNNLMSEAMLDSVYMILMFVIFTLGIISAAIMSKRKGFFKLDSREDIPFKGAMRASIISVGMMIFLINGILTTIQTLSIFNFSLFGT